MYYNKYLKYKEKYIGGWINIQEENKKICEINTPSIINRLKAEMDHYDYTSFTETSDKVTITKENTKKFKLKFKINIVEYNKLEVIGSFIRTTVRMLNNFNPNDILFILDYSKCDIKMVNQLIKKLISNSTTSAIFTNTIIVLNQSNYTKIKIYDNLCIDIIDNETMNKLLENYKPLYVKNYNGLIEKNLFDLFCSHKQYILLDCDSINFSIIYSPLIFELATYSNKRNQACTEKQLVAINDIDPSSDRLYIVCIEKIPNMYRIIQLFIDYKLCNKLIIYSPLDINNPLTIKSIKLLKDNGGVLYNKNLDESKIIDLINIKKREEKNIVSVDLDEKAIVYKYGQNITELSNSVIIFGFESSGIPEKIRKLSNIYVQLDSKTSINVVATVSIFLYSLHNIIV
jgi:hypothetical protein